MQIFNKVDLSSPVIAAILAAILFGASTPFAKILVCASSPILIAGLLYFGSGLGLMLIRLIRDRGWSNPKLRSNEWPWLFGAISFGGVLGPMLLMYGLTQISSATASLLLNLEAVLTSIIAWVIFKENADKRIVLGMFLIVLGGILLSWTHNTTNSGGWLGSLAIAGACLCWAIDNNLTRKVSALDSFFIAGSKGLIAGIVNIYLAYKLGSKLPELPMIITVLICGFFGYGLSLLLFIFALRGLGTSRTGAYFSVAPFIGAGIAILFFRELSTPSFWIALAFMGAGVWLHLTEKHEHEHIHAADCHEHSHRHDEHHQHSHDFAYDGSSEHRHQHEHNKLQHAHHHYPDVEHLHTH